MPGCKIVHTRVHNVHNNCTLCFLMLGAHCTSTIFHLCICGFWPNPLIWPFIFEYAWLLRTNGSIGFIYGIDEALFDEKLPMQHLSLSKDNIKECFYLFNIERCHTVLFIHSFIHSSKTFPCHRIR